MRTGLPTCCFFGACCTVDVIRIINGFGASELKSNAVVIILIDFKRRKETKVYYC